jgi:DNA-binding response OmpR family regulator
MLHVILASTRLHGVHTFAATLSSDPEVRLEQVGSGAEAIEAVRSSSPHLLIIDRDLPDIDPASLISKVLMVDAMVNTAVVSRLSEEAFHEASEGLGILGRVPVEPGPGDARDLLAKLRRVLGRPG